MHQRRYRTSQLRQPFVVTVALGASAVACGGEVVDDASTGNTSDATGGASAGGSGPVGGTATGGAPASTTCPASLPEHGDPCRVAAGIECFFGTDGCGESAFARCVGGLWDVSSGWGTCNPPPPPDDFCPVVEPSPGEYCNTSPGLWCPYGDCDGWPLAEARCEGFAWEVSHNSCNPPAPECPADMPMASDPCEWWGWVNCGYGPSTGCEGGFSTEAECLNGEWLVYSVCDPPPDADAGGPTDAGTGG
jgi:hypothetical protein